MKWKIDWKEYFIIQTDIIKKTMKITKETQRLK